MARFTIASALLAVASVVSAQGPTTGYDAINKPADGETVQAGTTYTITWTPAAQYPGTVKLAVIGGQTQGTQVPLYTIGTADNAAGQLAWSVDCAYSGLPFYGLTITDASDSSIFQYSSPFKIVSSDACNSQSSTSASSSATVTATLSSVYSHSTAASNATVTTSSCTTSTYPATTVVPNYNNTKTTFSKTPVVVTATSYSTANATAAVTSHPSTVVTSGASSIGGSIVMLAGVAAAFFVL